MEEKTKEDYLKHMYGIVYDELNRGRDWPIKIMAFASAAYFAMFSLLKFDNNHVSLNCWIKVALTILLLILLIWTIVVIIKQHLNYLKHRNIQIRLQKAMEIYKWEVDGKEIFPGEWKDDIPEKIRHGFSGWGFYATYMIIISVITLILIWNF